MIDFWQILAILAGIFGVIYPIFQVLHILKTPQSVIGISGKFILFWSLDKLTALILLWHIGSIPMVFKYLFGLVCVGIIAYFKFFFKSKPLDKNPDFM